jgi:hypothetical protein
MIRVREQPPIGEESSGTEIHVLHTMTQHHLPRPVKRGDVLFHSARGPDDLRLNVGDQPPQL